MKWKLPGTDGKDKKYKNASYAKLNIGSGKSSHSGSKMAIIVIVSTRETDLTDSRVFGDFA